LWLGLLHLVWSKPGGACSGTLRSGFAAVSFTVTVSVVAAAAVSSWLFDWVVACVVFWVVVLTGRAVLVLTSPML
jgi:hypothetical protein